MTLTSVNVPQQSASHPPRLPLDEGATWDGQNLKAGFLAATAWLEQHAATLNALNVYPVPDGDTGTNMYLTLQAAVKPIANSPTHSAAELLQALARGALMGSRGNSGVILSQVLRGMHEGLASKEAVSAVDFAAAMEQANARAYRAVQKPVEGTILTAMREMAAAAQTACKQENSFGHLFAEVCSAGRASVDRTPELLDKLRQAGVVDAGAEGLLTIFDGIRRYAVGEDIASRPVDIPDTMRPITASADAPPVNIELGQYGYCTNFMVFGKGINFEQARDKLNSMGDSAVVVGDDTLLKVHIHTEHPGQVLEYATSLGSMRQIKVDNMQDQHEHFVDSHASGADLTAFAPPGSAGAVSPSRSFATADTEQQAGEWATNSAATSFGPGVVAVVSGPGLERVFRSMGASRIVTGGQTMNPSTADLLDAVEKLPNHEVIILPNNGNIIMAANQVQQLTSKKVSVVPTRTIPQGVAALLAINYDTDMEANTDAMKRAAEEVITGEITTAVRDTSMNGMEVKEGDTIGLLDDALVVAGKGREQVIRDLISKMGLKDREVLTLYYGKDIDSERVQRLSDGIRAEYPNLEVEVVDGGQPFYDYIISAE
jgi:uncharacterized protein